MSMMWPQGYEPVRLDTMAAGRVIAHHMLMANERAGAISLDALQSDYADLVAQGDRSDATEAGLPAGPASRYPVLYATVMRCLNEWWHKGDLWTDRCDALIDAVAAAAPALLSVSAFDRSSAGTDQESRLWHSLADVSLLLAACADHDSLGGQRVSGLVVRFEAEFPRWRERYTAGWRAPEPRAAAVLFPLASADQWAHAQLVLLGTAGQVSAPNAANVLRYALHGIPEPWAAKHATLVARILGAGVTTETVAPGGARSAFDDGRPQRLGQVLKVALEKTANGISGHEQRVRFWCHQVLGARLPNPTEPAPSSVPRL